MMPMWQDRAFIQLPGLHPLILSWQGITACFHLLFCNKIPCVCVEGAMQGHGVMDELVTLGLARVQETSSIIDHGTHLLVNQMKEFTLF